VIYEAFIAGSLPVPRRLGSLVHQAYFNPILDDFKPRTMWSLSNAFTGALATLDPIPQMQGAAKLGTFLQAVN
jgi:hypothetical protein